MDFQRTQLFLAAGALALCLADGASADGGKGRGFRPAAPVPLPLVDTFSATPMALLQRDFAYMRATTPGAGRFQHHHGHGGFGRVNPPYSYYPPVYPYGGYFNNSYGYYPSYGSYGYPPVVQREVIVVPSVEVNVAPSPPASGGLRVSPETPPETRPEPRPDAPPKTESERSGDFYLKERGEGESLSDVLDDVRKAWLTGDWARLKARCRAEGKIGIYTGGVFKYSMESAEFGRMLKDAMIRTDTTAFELDKPKSDQPGRAFVTGKHRFLDADRNQQETHVSYALEKIDGRWKITEAGSSSSPITRHELPGG